MTAATLRSSAGRRTCPIIAARLRPIWPKPSSTTSIRSGWMTPPPAMRESWKASWIRRWASPACFASTTTEMLSSELPCAIATTLILRRRQRAEHGRRDAGRAVHAEPDHRHRRHARA